MASGSCHRRDRERDRGTGSIDRAGERPGRVGGRWGERSLTAVAALFALFLGLPVLTLVVRAVLDGSLAVAVASPEVLTRSG